MDFRKLLGLVTGGTVVQGGTPGGAASYMDEIGYMISKGMGRYVTVGAFSTGIVGGGNGTVLDAQQPELAIAVPSGTTIRPVRFSVQVQVGLFAADNDESEALISVDSKGLWTGDGTFTIQNPSNMRTSNLVGSACRVGSAFTVNMTTTPVAGAAAAPVRDIDLARAVETSDIFSTGTGILIKRLDLLYEPRHPPYIVGPATVLVYYGGTIATIGGFIQAAWVEGPNASFYL